MKKKVITATLLCCAMAPCSLATTYTFESVLDTIGTQTDTENAYPKSAYDVVKGYDSTNYAEDSATPDYGIYRVGQSTVSGVTTSLNTLAYTTADGTYTTSDQPDWVQLTSISLISSNYVSDTNVTPQSLCLSVTVGGTTYYSNEATYDDDARTNNKYGTLTFTFKDSLTLSTSTSYAYSFVTKGTDNSGEATYTAKKVQIGQFQSRSSSGNGYAIDGKIAYTAVMKVTAESVPEPATASLSLLALAGLAARRRRR